MPAGAKARVRRDSSLPLVARDADPGRIGNCKNLGDGTRMRSTLGEPSMRDFI